MFSFEFNEDMILAAVFAACAAWIGLLFELAWAFFEVQKLG
jgi:hypothetical protein